jgi:hypothetical protein
MPPNDKFDVYVEGVRDKSPQGVQRAAQALAPKLSMPTEKVAKLLAGRFRVRTGVDEDIGRKLVGDLEAFGLRVVIVPQGAKPGAPAAAPPAPPAPRAVAHAPTMQAAPPPPAPMPVEDPDGGISIGGLELMGNATPAAEPAKAAAPAAPPPAALQPQGFMPSSFGPPPEEGEIDLAAPAPSPPPKPIAKAAPPPPADPFAPPESAADHGIDLDVSGPKARTAQPAAPKRGTTVPPQAGPTQSQRMSAIKMKQKIGESRARALRGGLIVMVVAVAIGYFPAHLYAKYVDDTKVVELQKEYRQLEVNPWKGEATHRTKEKVRDEIRDIRWNAMLLMMGIWAACSGLLAALAYVLF